MDTRERATAGRGAASVGVEPEQRTAHRLSGFVAAMARHRRQLRQKDYPLDAATRATIGEVMDELPDLDPYFSLPTEDEYSDEPEDGTPYDMGYRVDEFFEEE
jgi:hypothetical protein